MGARSQGHRSNPPPPRSGPLGWGGRMGMWVMLGPRSRSHVGWLSCSAPTAPLFAASFGSPPAPSVRSPGAGLRVPRAHGDAIERGARGGVDGDRPGRGRVDHPGPAHEGERGAPGPAQPSRLGDTRGSAGARPGHSGGVSGRAGTATRARRNLEPAQDGSDRGGAARVPVKAFGTGRPRRRIVRAKWRKRRWRTRCATRSRRPTGAPTCSSAGAGSWTIGQRTLLMKAPAANPKARWTLGSADMRIRPQLASLADRLDDVGTPT